MSRKPTTRLQLRKETEGEKGEKTIRERVNLKVIEEISNNQKENHKGWTNLKDVENKLAELENQYKKAKKESTKKQISSEPLEFVLRLS